MCRVIYITRGRKRCKALPDQPAKNRWDAPTNAGTCVKGHAILDRTEHRFSTDHRGLETCDFDGAGRGFCRGDRTGHTGPKPAPPEDRERSSPLGRQCSCYHYRAANGTIPPRILSRRNRFRRRSFRTSHRKSASITGMKSRFSTTSLTTSCPGCAA